MLLHLQYMYIRILLITIAIIVMDDCIEASGIYANLRQFEPKGM